MTMTYNGVVYRTMSDKSLSAKDAADKFYDKLNSLTVMQIEMKDKSIVLVPKNVIQNSVFNFIDD